MPNAQASSQVFKSLLQSSSAKLGITYYIKINININRYRHISWLDVHPDKLHFVFDVGYYMRMEFFQMRKQKPVQKATMERADVTLYNDILTSLTRRCVASRTSSACWRQSGASCVINILASGLRGTGFDLTSSGRSPLQKILCPRPDVFR